MATVGSTSRTRITGLAGFDTQSMVEQLINAESFKVTTAKKSLIKMQWRQDALRETANSLRTFRDTYLSFGNMATNFRSQTMFKANKASVKVSGADDKGVSVATSNSSKAGKYEVELKQLAQKHTYTSSSGFNKINAEKNVDLNNLRNLKEGDSFGVVLDGKTYTLNFKGDDLKAMQEAESISEAAEKLQDMIDNAVGKESSGASKIKIEQNGDKLAFSPTAGHTVSFTELSSSSYATSKEVNLNNLSNETLQSISENGLKFEINGQKVIIDKNDFDFTIPELAESATEEEKNDHSENVATARKEAIERLGELIATKATAIADSKAEVTFEKESGMLSFTALDKADNVAITRIENPEDGDTSLPLDALGMGNTTITNHRMLDMFGISSSSSSANVATTTKLGDMFSGAFSGMVKAKDEEGNDLLDENGEAVYATEISINNQTIKLNSNDTLQNMIDKVNKSGVGVTMSYSAFSGAISLTANETGTAASIKQLSGALLTDEANGLGLKSSQAASDAVFTVNGEQTSRSSNSFDLEGSTVTFDKNTKIGTTYEINIGADNDEIVSNVKKFIESYNKLITDLTSKTTDQRAKSGSYSYYEPLLEEEKAGMSENEIKLWEEKAKQGILNRDDTLTKIASDMRSWMFEAVDLGGGKSISLYEIGVSSASWYEGGKLTIDEDKLKKTLSQRPDDVAALFTKSSDIPRFEEGKGSSRYRSEGLADRLDDIIDEAINSNSGSLVNRAGMKGSKTESQNPMSKQIKEQNDKIERMLEQLTQKENRYYSMFAAMEKAMTNSNNQVNWLSAQMGR